MRSGFPILILLLASLTLAAVTSRSGIGNVPEDAAEAPSNAEGQALAERLRHGWPEDNMNVSGQLKIRERGRPIRRVPIQFSVIQGTDSWKAVYVIPPAQDIPAEKLVITHTPGTTNRYEFTSSDSHNAPFNLFKPLGGSDFWIVDLGLDFLHWPGQRMIKTEMRKGRWCRVLESSREPRADHEYSSVISWLDKEHGQPILAEAYDAKGELMKEFSIGSFKKVDGQWQLEDMKIVNVQTRSRTELEFDLE